MPRSPRSNRTSPLIRWRRSRSSASTSTTTLAVGKSSTLVREGGIVLFIGIWINEEEMLLSRVVIGRPLEEVSVGVVSYLRGRVDHVEAWVVAHLVEEDVRHPHLVETRSVVDATPRGASPGRDENRPTSTASWSDSSTSGSGPSRVLPPGSDAVRRFTYDTAGS